MREIKFRGKAVTSTNELEEIGIEHENGWVYGNLVMYGNTPYIVGDFVEVDQEYTVNEFWVAVHPESVGQFTGLRDKNGKEIYEGYILGAYDEKPLLVRYSEEHGAFVFFDYFDPFGIIILTTDDISYEAFEIIGNIYEDKHLLESEVTE